MLVKLAVNDVDVRIEDERILMELTGARRNLRGHRAPYGGKSGSL
jgi:hypothetical protein